jgi:hypothetical protein
MGTTQLVRDYATSSFHNRVRDLIQRFDVDRG